MLTFTSPQLQGLVKKRVEHQHFAAVDALAGLEFKDVDDSIREDVAFVKNHPLILKETIVTGYKYEGELVGALEL
jgi:carbonic anhydrase